MSITVGVNTIYESTLTCNHNSHMGTRLRIIVNYGMGYVIRNITGQSKDDVGVVFVCRKTLSQLDKISPYD